MLRAALKGRGYHESTYPPRGQTISRSASNASRLSSTSDASRTTLDPTITAIIPLVRNSNSESSSVSSFYSGHTFGHTNHGSCMHLRATSDTCAKSSIGFNHADGDYDRADDAGDGLSVSSFCQVGNHRQPEGIRYRCDINNKCLNASAMSGSTSVTSPDGLTSTMASHSISTHCLIPRPRRTSFGERESVHSHHMANQNADPVDRTEFESRLHFRATKSEGSIAVDLSYDSESTALTDNNKWTSSSVSNANTNKPVKGLRRLCRRFSWKEKRISGSSASSSSRSTAVWMPSWSLPLSPPRAKQLASEQKSCASRRSSSEQSFAVLPMWSSVSCGIIDGGNNAPSSTLESSSEARGPTTEQHVCCPAKTSQSTLSILLRTAEPTSRTVSPKPSCTCYNRNVRGPCIFHKNLRDAQKLSKRRSRDVLHKQNGTETSRERSNGRKRISHRLSGFSTAVVAAAKRMSLDAGPKRTSVRGAPTAALTVEVAVLETKTHHQPKEVRQLSSRSTFMTTDYHAQRDSRLLNSSSFKPSMSEHSSCSELHGDHTMDKCEREQRSLLQDQQQNISYRRQLDLQTTPASSACIPTRSLSKTSSPSYAVRGRMRRPTLPSPLVSSIHDPNICAQVSAINVCAEIIRPRPHIRARSATIGRANQNEIKTNAHSCKRRSIIATRTVTTRTTAALATATATATARTRTLSEDPINRGPPYEKEKLVFFEPFRSQNQSSTYVSFHHDLSHLESGPLLENMDDYDASKDSSCAESEHGDPDKVAPSSPIVPSQCSKPTRAKRTAPSLPSMSLPNLAGSAVNLMITLPPSHKRHPAPPPPPPRPRPHSPREDEGPFLTLQEYLWQKERALVATAPKSIASNCHHSDDPGSGLKGMASSASLPTVLPSSAASPSASASLLSTSVSAAAPVSGLSKVTRTRAGQKRWGWLSWIGP